MTAALLLVSVLAETAGNLCLAKSEGVTRSRFSPWLVPMCAAYLLSVGLLWAVLSRPVPVGAVYAIWTALTVALTAVSARVVFRDRLGRAGIAGMAIMLVGVVLLEIGGSVPA